MLQKLVCTFFPVPAFRNHTMRCLTEIGSLDIGDQYTLQFVELFVPPPPPPPPLSPQTSQ
jgi:hypothetical protein